MFWIEALLQTVVTVNQTSNNNNNNNRKYSINPCLEMSSLNLRCRRYVAALKSFLYGTLRFVVQVFNVDFDFYVLWSSEFGDEWRKPTNAPCKTPLLKRSRFRQSRLLHYVTSPTPCFNDVTCKQCPCDNEDTSLVFLCFLCLCEIFCRCLTPRPSSVHKQPFKDSIEV